MKGSNIKSKMGRFTYSACALFFAGGLLVSCEDELLTGMPSWLVSSINEEMENCNMVFFEKKNPILMQNPHSLLQCPLQKLIPGQKVKVRITFIAYNGMSNAELVS